MVNLTTLAFWKKKSSSTPEPERIIPLPPLPGPSVLQSEMPSADDVNKARESLKVLRLERQIIGSALTTIFESETKGIISQVERDRLVGKYKVDLEQLDKTIEEHQRIVDLCDLQNSREELIRNFNTKLAELDTKIKSLKTGNPGPVENSQAANTSSATLSTNPEEHQVTDAEKRVEQIREEILKAMDRLEQIESEG